LEEVELDQRLFGCRVLLELVLDLIRTAETRLAVALGGFLILLDL
jgi:hypothetical protein